MEGRNVIRLFCITVLFACATAALVIYAHRGNIRRMLDGTESRFASPAARWLRRGQ